MLTLRATNETKYTKLVRYTVDMHTRIHVHVTVHAYTHIHVHVIYIYMVHVNTGMHDYINHKATKTPMDTHTHRTLSRHTHTN